MKLRDAIMIPALVLPLIPAVIMGFTGYGWYYFAAIFIFYLVFGLLEYLSGKNRGTPITKDIANTPSALFWSIIVTWTAMHILLTWHWILYR